MSPAPRCPRCHSDRWAQTLVFVRALPLRLVGPLGSQHGATCLMIWHSWSLCERCELEWGYVFRSHVNGTPHTHYHRLVMQTIWESHPLHRLADPAAADCLGNYSLIYQLSDLFLQERHQ